ncbi:MAG: filamentous hemagglutinin N-terminal domain-containing protein [Nodularia sp. CChRGM 3473]
MVVIIGIDNCTYAQIIEDNTLPNNSTVTPSRNTFLIEGGTPVGNNLFHSFTQFSLPKDYTAYFNNDRHIQNIFSRITGGFVSNIDGIITANRGANLFILNPNGIIFGPNARLDISGSFVASTANSIKFTDGVNFSANPSVSTPLLTVKIPIGLQYGVNPGKIHVQGDSQIKPTELQVQPNQTLALIGGNVILENTRSFTYGTDSRIELGSVAAESLVGITSTKQGFLFNYDAVPNFGNIAFQNTFVESVGDLQITGKNIILTDGILNGANNLTVNATEKIQLIGNSSIYSASSVSTPANLTINARTLLLQDASNIGVDRGNLTVNVSETVQLIGDASNRTLNNQNNSSQSSRIFATAPLELRGIAGNLIINTRNLLVQDGAQISTSSAARISEDSPFGTTKGGNLTVNASESVKLLGSSVDEIFPSGLLTRSSENGDTGDLTINTGILLVQDGAQVITRNVGTGKSGNLTVNAIKGIQLIGTSLNGRIPNSDVAANTLVDQPIFDSLTPQILIKGILASDTLPSGLFASTVDRGNAGNVTINTRDLLVQDGAQISADTFAEGEGGNLTVNATKQVQLIGASVSSISSGLFTRTNSESTGAAGSLTIFTDNLLVRDGAQVSASTFGVGKGGNLTVNATEEIQLIGVSNNNVTSGLFAQANSGATGNAGDVNLNTSALIVKDGAQVSASTFGTGEGGNLKVNATESVQLIGNSANGLFPSGLFAVAAPGSSGKAGELTINTGTLLVRDGAQVAASTFAQGQGGNLKVNATERVQLIGNSANGSFPSGLFATATKDATGGAGDLTVNTNILQIQHGAGIAVRSRGQGSAGNLNLDARSILLNNQAFISADTRASNSDSHQSQATISLRSSDLLMLLRGSTISTNATGNNVIGGNININTDLLAAIDNSDISANSVNFRGGRVNIKAQGIFGTQLRNALTPKSDITATGASPELSGSVQITTPDVDPSQGLTQFPLNVSDVTNQIAQKCRTGGAIAQRQNQNQLIITGRSGIPSHPYEVLQSESVITNWVTVDDVNNVAQNETNVTKMATPGDALVEAQFWLFDSNGDVVLAAEVPKTVIPRSPTLKSTVCSS